MELDEQPNICGTVLYYKYHKTYKIDMGGSTIGIQFSLFSQNKVVPHACFEPQLLSTARSSVAASKTEIYRERGVMGTHRIWDAESRFKSDVFYQCKTKALAGTGLHTKGGEVKLEFACT